MAQTEEFIATGRRKTSVARVRMSAGSGKIDINGRSFEDYFPSVPLQNVVLQPLQVAKVVNTYDVSINAYPQSKIHYRIIAKILNAPKRLSHRHENHRHGSHRHESHRHESRRW